MSAGVFAGMPLVDDRTVMAMYFLKSKTPTQGIEIYVEVDDLIALGQLNAEEGQTQTTECDPLQLSPIDTTGYYESQLLQLESGCAQPTSSRRKKDGGRRKSDNCPSSSHAVEDIDIEGTRTCTVNTSTIWAPQSNIDIDVVDVQEDSDPEPDEPDSDNDESDDYGTGLRLSSGVDARLHRDEGPSAPWPLHYEAGIDAALQFDPLSIGAKEKLKLWND